MLLRSEAALYSPPGYLLFIRQGTLLAQRFDAGKFQLSGDPIPIAEQVPFEGASRGFSVSENGVLVYRNGVDLRKKQLAWYDRTGELLEPVGTPGGYTGPELAPDGKQIAVRRDELNGSDIWLFESSETPTRLTFDATQDNSMPVWSPDGKRLAFASRRNEKWGLYVKFVDNTGKEELVESDLIQMLYESWSPDGKFIVYWIVDPKTGSDQWVIPLEDRKAFPILQSPAQETFSQISPDGKWIAYDSNETGRDEIYIRPFPNGDGKWQVSAGRLLS